MKVRRLVYLSLTIIVLNAFWLSTLGRAMPASQSTQEIAQQILSGMQPEEKVGQLFLISFYGPEAAPSTEASKQIYDLIINYHIGGVILQAKNDNFLGGDQTIPILMSLTDQLQRNEYSASRQNQVNAVTNETFRPVYIPLFIGISQNGGGSPYDQILHGVTTLPNQMAIGATWQPDLARQVGEALGRELSILGINLVLGPSLDILELRFSGNPIGLNSFGSDPFWVAEMSRAYIAGLHQGSNNRLAVIGKYFPGYGSADRSPEEEVATIRKTLEQLKQFELYPFFATTGLAPSPEAALDGILTAHIRIQGFQENFRQTTKPISFDPQAFSNLIKLPALDSWRQNGGIAISDSLGSRAVRRFYDPTLQTFNGRLVALDAFLAGNDMLYLDNFVSTNDPDAYTTITRTLKFFAQKYREDPAFAQRVDQSVLRILSLKLRMYDNSFMLNKVQPLVGSQSELGKSGDLTFRVASEAATLISPPPSEFDLNVPDLRDQIVFITDVRLYQQCSLCIQEPMIASNAMEQIVVRLYSPAGRGQVLPGNLMSYTYQDLYNMLEGGIGETEIEASIRQAEWVVFLAMDANPSSPVTLSLERFLDKRPDLYQGKRLVAFAMGLPYNLGATEISKLSAFYGLYGRSKEFIEIAARLLFQEVQPTGKSPVSIPGIGYDINRITFPDPNQVIPLTLEKPLQTEEEPALAPEATPSIYTFRIGDLLEVKAGAILDYNGNIVPDGTIVRFVITQGGELGTARQIESQTVQGIARATIRIDTSGNLEIRAESEDAKTSNIIQIAVPPENATTTPAPTETPTITPTTQPSPTAEPTATSTPTPEAPVTETQNATILDWLTGMGVSIAIALTSYYYSQVSGQLRWAVRSGLLVLIGGILAYTYIALEMPGSAQILSQNNLWNIVIVTCLGACLGWLATLIWKHL